VKRRGSTFVITLAVISALTVVVAGISSTISLASRARVNREAARRARVVALSGIQYGFSALVGQSTATTGQNDTWATTGCSAFTSPADIVYQVGDGYFRVQVVDATSLVDINTAPAAQLQNLPLTQEQVDSLLDFRSAGETARPDGAKDSVYNSLAQPYNAKLGRLDTIDELLQVQYFTRDTIWDIPTTSANPQVATGSSGLQPTLASMIAVDATATLPSGAGRINVSTTGGNQQQLSRQLQGAGLPISLVTQIIQRRPFTTYGALLRLPGVTIQQATIMLTRLQVSAATTAEGRINLNTATQAVLQTLPNLQSDVAQAIVSHQNSPLANIGALMSIPGVSVPNAAAFVDSVTVGSQTFLIRVVGWVGNTSVALEATVTIAGGTPKITKIVDQPFPNMDVRWNWADAASTNTLVDPSQVTTQ